MTERRKKIIKKICTAWSFLVISPIMKITKALNKDGSVSEQIMTAICSQMEKDSPCYLSFMMRPKKCKTIIPKHYVNKRIAVIIQGPIVKEDDFTLNTVQFYKSISSISDVIVSTWKTEDSEYLKRISCAGAKVITSETPKNPGIGNINYQLISTKAGIKAAKELGAEYICKTRSDQRIYNEFAFDMMLNLVDIFPVGSRNGLGHRIVALATEYENMFFPYYISDFLYFGTSYDMSFFLQIPEEKRDVRPQFTNYRKRVMELGNGEVYILRNLMKIIGIEKNISIKDYWSFVKDSLVVLGKGEINLYWYKYDGRYCEHKRNGTYFTGNVSPYMTSNFNFSSWLSLLQEQLEYLDEYEQKLD